jgi:hypothetical protein
LVISNLKIEGIHYNLTEETTAIARKFFKLIPNSNEFCWVMENKPVFLLTQENPDFSLFNLEKLAIGKSETDDIFMNKWVEFLLQEVQSKKEKLIKEIDNLNKRIMTLKADLGIFNKTYSGASSFIKEAIGKSLRSISEIKGIRKIEYTGNKCYMYTEDIYVQALTRKVKDPIRFHGTFIIELSLGGAIRVKNLSTPDGIGKSYGTLHGTCLGGYTPLISSALEKMDYYTVVLTILEFLRTVNEDVDHHFSDFKELSVNEKTGIESNWINLIDGSDGADDDERNKRSIIQYTEMINIILGK